jgi:hypothetical protein
MLMTSLETGECVCQKAGVCCVFVCAYYYLVRNKSCFYELLFVVIHHTGLLCKWNDRVVNESSLSFRRRNFRK